MNDLQEGGLLSGSALLSSKAVANITLLPFPAPTPAPASTVVLARGRVEVLEDVLSST